VSAASCGRTRRVGVVLGVIGMALLAAFAALADTSLPAAWKNWHYSRAVELSPADATVLSGVTVPPEVFRHARRWLPDVRVIDDGGAEIPYVLFIREGANKSEALKTILHERSFAPGLYTQLVVEVGEQAHFHNAIEIQTSEQDFIEWVRVDASDNGHVWRMVQPRAPIFRFHKDSLEGTRTVHYSENNAHFLRVQILDGDKQFPIDGGNVFYKTVEPPERAPLDVAVAVAAQTNPQSTSWTADLGAMEEPLADVKFEVAAPAEFIRSVSVQASSDNKNWRQLARSEIYRYQQAGALAEQLSVSIPFGGAQSRYWRVEIVNHNDAPLSRVVPHLYSIPRHVIFEQQPGRSYRLIYGQERADRAQYDLERRLDAKQMAAAVAGQLGPEEVNAGWVDPRPWTETHDIFLWLVLVVAVLLLGYAAVRSLRRSAASAS
jgi:Protein of unknown function (DUF3999)